MKYSLIRAMNTSLIKVIRVGSIGTTWPLSYPILSSVGVNLCCLAVQDNGSLLLFPLNLSPNSLHNKVIVYIERDMQITYDIPVLCIYQCSEYTLNKRNFFDESSDAYNLRSNKLNNSHTIWRLMRDDSAIDLHLTSHIILNIILNRFAIFFSTHETTHTLKSLLVLPKIYSHLFSNLCIFSNKLFNRREIDCSR